eukprot:COSAG04_NODE_3543_length_2722_cov_75.937095_2_plen_113_part_00
MQPLPPKKTARLPQTQKKRLPVWGKGVSGKTQTPLSEQPRVQFERVITPDEAAIFDFIAGPSTQGVCQQLMAGDDPSVDVLPVETAMLTNPAKDYGPWKWHRCGPARPLPFH